MADGNTESPVARGGGEGERPVAGGGGEGARPVAGAAGRDARPVAGAAVASADNAAKDSQTGQTLPLQGRIAGTTRSRMVA